MSRLKAEKSPQKITIECHDIFEVSHDTIRQDNFIVATKAKAAEAELCRDNTIFSCDKDQAGSFELCRDKIIFCLD